MRVATRVQGFTESVIREMTRLCQQHGGINLAQGFPDFPAPQALKEAACRAVMDDVNQYAITWGARNLREAIAAKAREFNRIPDVDPDRHVTVTCGATEAMMATMLALVEPGDEVVVFEPYYENYGPDAIMSQATLRFVPLELRDGVFRFDPARLAAAFGPRTRCIVVNTPHNPTGKVFDRTELEQMAALCREYDALAVTDEIYEHMVYEGEHVSIASLSGMAERTVTISGLSKTFAVTGWRLGYAIAPPAISDAIRRVHDFLTVGAPAPLQEAAVTALGFGPAYYADLVDRYRERRATMHAILVEAGLPPIMPQGAYYMLADIRRLGMSDLEMARFLVEEVGVAIVPGTSFYADKALGRNFIRFAFPKKPETLAAARARLLNVTALLSAKAI
ncbi:MAG: aminotransferase class I/II-fold pyridoxal phosphate-dependent enzyme [Candidatus Sericytochromatia bacterium]|nr:aminotransferase class I/II-fold pyridoxal phosphate-dependent enzyme [Candidatus Tanganyikabacteria bacterium]